MVLAIHEDGKNYTTERIRLISCVLEGNFALRANAFLAIIVYEANRISSLPTLVALGDANNYSTMDNLPFTCDNLAQHSIGVIHETPENGIKLRS